MKKALLVFIMTALAVGNVAFAEDPPTLVWNKVYDSGDYDNAYGVAVDALANVYVTGPSYNGTDNDFRTICYDSEGNILWNKTYDSGEFDNAQGAAVDDDGNVYVTGYSGDVEMGIDDDYRTIKYDSEGNIQWNKVYDSGNVDKAYGVAVDALANVYVTGPSHNGTDYDFRTICYDSEGNILWNKVYDSGEFDNAQGAAVDDDGNVYVTGYSGDVEMGIDDDYRTIKYDSEGNIQWNKVYDSGNVDEAYGVAVDRQANVYVTGRSGGDYRTICYDSEGNILWNKVYYSGDSGEAQGVAVDDDANVYVTGWSYNATDDYFRTIKYDSDGNLQWNKVYDSGDVDRAYGVAVDDDANVYVTGWSYNGSDTDYRTIKYEQHTAIAEQPPTNSPLTLEVVTNLSATPTLSYTLPAGMTGTLTFYSADGRAIETFSLSFSQSTFTWDVHDVPVGVYFAELTVGSYSQTAKAVLIR